MHIAVLLTPDEADYSLMQHMLTCFPDLREIKEEAIVHGNYYIRRVFNFGIDMLNGEYYIHF